MFLLLISNLILLWSENIVLWFKYLKIYWNLFFGSELTSVLMEVKVNRSFQILYILTDIFVFLIYQLFIDESLNLQLWLQIYLSLYFCKCLLHVFWNSITAYSSRIVTYPWCINPFFIIKWSTLSLVILLVFKSIFSDINVALIAFLCLMFALYISFHPLTSTQLYFYISGVFLVRST